MGIHETYVTLLPSVSHNSVFVCMLVSSRVNGDVICPMSSGRGRCLFKSGGSAQFDWLVCALHPKLSSVKIKSSFIVVELYANQQRQDTQSVHVNVHSTQAPPRLPEA